VQNTERLECLRHDRENLRVQVVERSRTLRIEAQNGVESVCRMCIFIVDEADDGSRIYEHPGRLVDQVVKYVR
jgi:hypothetical protein